jgi:hypothetical protein
MAFQPNIKSVPTRNAAGQAIVLINQAARGGRIFVPYYFFILTETGAGLRVLQVNEAIAGREYVPDPSVTTTSSRFEGSSIELPDGFVGEPYAYTWTFLGEDTVISFDSGSIPPGLHFRMLDPRTWEIKGEPTTIGVYQFNLKSESAGGEGLLHFIVHILEVEEGGTAYVGGQ